MWVTDTGSSNTLRSLRCAEAVAGALRELGYESSGETQAARARVQVTVSGQCHPAFNGGSCYASGTLVVRGRGSYSLDASSTHEHSLDFARSEACSELVKQVRAKVGGPVKGQPGAAGPGAATAKIKLSLVVSWQGEITPMPLLKLTSFLQKTGTPYKLLGSGPQECRFQIDLEDTPESFASLLETFLQAHYLVEAEVKAGQPLKVRLSPR